MLHGLCLLGRRNNDYSVTLTLKESSYNSAVVTKTGTFPSKLLQYGILSSYTFTGLTFCLILQLR